MQYRELFKAVFGEELKVEKYKYVAHSPRGKVVGKTYCVGCGLIYLNNNFSRWAVDKGCLHELHSSYKQKRKLR